MRTLVAAGLFNTKAEVLRGALLRIKLLASRKLEWYLERRVAVLEAGGTADDVLAACIQSYSLQFSSNACCIYVQSAMPSWLYHAKSQHAALTRPQQHHDRGCNRTCVRMQTV